MTQVQRERVLYPLYPSRAVTYLGILHGASPDDFPSEVPRGTTVKHTLLIHLLMSTSEFPINENCQRLQRAELSFRQLSPRDNVLE